MTILVTGAAGFIGYHLTKRLIKHGSFVVGLDNLNNYYDVKLKKARLEDITKNSINKNNKNLFEFVHADLADESAIRGVFERFKPDIVVNLAAQAGVRYSIENPLSYIKSNLVGFGFILEGCRNFGVKHLVYASSSSVYGGNTNLPFSEHQNVDHPVSLYAASKKSNELMTHSYSHLYNLSATGLRFFTVYGPWGRPDMALFLFTKSILENKPIQVFNEGKMIRDFTYIDDIIESMFRVINKPAIPNKNFDSRSPDSATSWAPHRIFNIGNSKPTPLFEYISAIEDCVGIKAKIKLMEMQPGDVKATAADTSLLQSWIDFKPSTPIRLGVSRFVKWYKDFYDL